MNIKKLLNSNRPAKDQIISGLLFFPKVLKEILVALINIIKYLYKKLKKPVLVLSSIVLLFAVIIPVLLSIFFGRDIPMFDDSDLSLELEGISNEENAYFPILDMKQFNLNKPSENREFWTSLMGTGWHEEVVDRSLSANKERLAKFDKISEMKKFAVVDWNNPELLYFFSQTGIQLRITKIAKLKAIKYARTGEINLAIQEATKILKLGRILETAQVKYYDYDNALVIKDDAMQLLAQLVSDYDLSEYNLDKISKLIDEYQIVSNDKMFKFYYMERKFDWQQYNEEGYNADRRTYARFFSNDLAWLKNFYFNNNFYYKPNKLLKMHAEDARKLIDEFNELCELNPELSNFNYLREITNKKDSYKLDYFSIITSAPKLYFKENLIGDILYNYHLPEGVKGRACYSKVNMNSLKTKIAIKKYLKDMGKYPDKLEDLVGVYIDELPLDPYTGGPLVYDSVGKTITSVSTYRYKEVNNTINRTKYNDLNFK